MAGPESPDLRFLEDVVTAHDFIRAFAGQNNFETAVSNQFGEETRVRSRSQNGLLGMRNDIRKYLPDIFGGAVDGGVLRSDERTCFVLIRALVELGVFKPNGERTQPVAYRLFDQCRDQRRVETAA